MIVPGWEWFSDRIDWTSLVRGASTAFTVLVVGGLASGFAARIPVLGPWWLLLVEIVACVIAGYRIGTALEPWLHGATAAVAGYLLTLPLLALGGPATLNAQVIVPSLGLAAVVGGLTGRLAGRARDRRAA